MRCLRVVIQLPGIKRILRDFKTLESPNLLDKPCFKLEIWVQCKLLHCELSKKIYALCPTTLFVKFKHGIKFIHFNYQYIWYSLLKKEHLGHFNIIFESVYSFPWSGALYQLPWPLVEFKLCKIFTTEILSTYLLFHWQHLYWIILSDDIPHWTSCFYFTWPYLNKNDFN